MVVFWDPGSVPENWRPMLSAENMEAGSSSISSNVGTEASGSMRSFSDGLDGGTSAGFCERCQNGKPPRCHHCSVCKHAWSLEVPIFFVDYTISVALIWQHNFQLF